MDTHISPQAISMLNARMLILKYHYGVNTHKIGQETRCPAIREILGNHDVTGRFAAQIRQAFLQGAI
jgi:hypothetical protein